MALPKLLRLPFRTDIGDGQWIELDEFISFLRQYHSPSDKIKKVKRSNIISEFKTHQVSLKEKDGILYITITSVLRYIFHHYDQQAICHECVHEIQQKISSEKTQAPCTVEEIYKRITNLAFRSSVIENHIFQNIDINETDIPSLYIQYKTGFSNVEWTKICYFEFHFCKRLEDLPVNYEYEYLIKKRLEFINEIETTNTVAQIAAKESRQLITERTKRKNIAIGNEDITIHVGKKHLPKVIETQILEEFCDCGINSVLCHECLKSCQHTKSVHLYVELQQNILEDVNNISEAITNFLANRHELTCAEILFLKQDTFLPYNDSLGRPYRYRFREDLLTMKRNDDILHHWTNSNISDIEIQLDGNNVGNCSSCYTLSIHKPLSWQSFHVLQEWTLDVPLIEQIILEKFININSVKKTGNLEVLLKNKFTRLYTAYDILLNRSNRLYTGVLQDLNSQELALNFQSVSTVFSVTQSSGATLSLNESERRLKEMANEDQCYYNTYLRKYDLEYYTEAGLCKKNINLKDCHLILFMDNLVRLKFRADPSPGESRALQLCTLPITLKGIPKDSLTVASWHEADCEGQDDCNCKKERKLTKEDFQKELTNLSANEVKMGNSFKKLLSWGFDILWLSIINGEAPDLYDQMSMEPDVEPLEASFASLNLESHNPMEETDLDDTIDYEPPLALNPEQFGDSLNNEDDSEEIKFPEISDIDSIDDRDFDDDQDSEDGSLLDNLLDEVDLLQIHDIQGFNDENDLDCFHVLNETQDDELQSSGDNTDIIQTTQLTSDETNEAAQTSLLEDLGFIQYKPPSLLTRHPPPATGRDDDLVNIRTVLDDILIKSEHSDESCVRFNKILFGPDNKIGNILLKLIAQNKKYKVFLPEFPLLHLRKSKINTVCSAYSKAGILHILKYMRDDDYKEWKKLISDDHIEQATRYIKRLSLAFHIAFMCRYLQTLDSDESKRICKLLASGRMQETEFESGYDAFIEAGCKGNATFCLHKEMMDHFDEIAAIALAERLGGEDGYCLLLSAVKNSLPLAFLNGASSYAAYCVNLLYNHFVSGPFYQNMKCSLFTTPHKGSIVNIALGAQREMDHKDVIKSFRSGSTMSSILPRMSLIDTLNQASNCSKRSLVMSDAGQDDQKVDERKILGISLNKTDVTYITRIATLILRQDGLSIKQDDIPYNVYSNPKSQLPISILDRHTVDVGKYLIQKYLCTSGLFQCSKNDTPSMQDLTGPKQLLQKVKSSKGVTIKRISSANT